MSNPCDSGGSASEAEHKLFSVIFSSYNQYIRPVENVTDPVIVQFEVSMSQLVKVVSEAVKKVPPAPPWRVLRFMPPQKKTRLAVAVCFKITTTREDISSCLCFFFVDL